MPDKEIEEAMREAGVSTISSPRDVDRISIILSDRMRISLVKAMFILHEWFEEKEREKKKAEKLE